MPLKLYNNIKKIGENFEVQVDAYLPSEDIVNVGTIKFELNFSSSPFQADLLYISTSHNREHKVAHLGAGLVFIMAEVASSTRIRNLSVASASPENMGFWGKMGFHGNEDLGVRSVLDEIRKTRESYPVNSIEYERYSAILLSTEWGTPQGNTIDIYQASVQSARKIPGEMMTVHDLVFTAQRIVADISSRNSDGAITLIPTSGSRYRRTCC